MRVSLYADDVVIFMNPNKQEMDVMLDILKNFGEATGLKINLAKSTATPICCDEINITEVLQNFGGQVVGFPLKYLGLPLTLKRTRLVHLQFVLNRIKARLAGWKGKALDSGWPQGACQSRSQCHPNFCPHGATDAKEILQGN